MTVLSKLTSRRRAREQNVATDGESSGARAGWRGLFVAWLHLAVLWAFAFAQPLFGVLSDSPEFFVARGNTTGDIVLFAIAVTVLPPTILVAVEALFLRLPRVCRGLHLFFVAVLAGAVALQLFDDVFGGSAAVLIVAGAIAGVAIAAAYALTRPVPELLTWLSPAPIVFLVIFLLISPVSKLVLPGGSAAASQEGAGSETPVVWVVMDEFDPNMLMNARQQVDRSRYPNFAALADTSTWYRNATTVSGQTSEAVPGLLSATRPEPDALPVAADYPNSVFTLLGESHAMRVEETATELCPERLCGERERESSGERLGSLGSDLSVVSLHLLLPEGMRDDLPAVDRTFGDFGDQTGADADAAKGAKGAFSNQPAEDRRKPIERYERGLKPTGDRPGFHFLHANLPHFPWEYLPTGQRYLVNGPQAPGLKDEWWSKEPYAARLGMQRHLLQTGYADGLVGRTMRRLRRAGLFDRAMVIFTADHGVSFRPGRSRRGITRETAADIAAVPLFVKYPGQRGGRIDTSMVRNIDVVPTIAKQVGASLAWRADGRPVRDGGPRSGTLKVSTGTTEDPVELSFADFVRERERGLRRMLATFGSDDGGAGLYATGPDRGLLGRSAAGLVAAGAPAGRVNLDSTTLLASFRPGGLAVPSFVTGKISGRAPVGARVAVAVNGTVRGVSVTFRDDGRHRFAVMVPPSSFRRGANAVDVYVVEGPVGSPRLGALSTERADQYRLLGSGDSLTIVGPSGRIPVERARVDGYIDSLVASSGTLRVGGWALERRTRGPVGTIVVFDGSRFLTSGEPNLPRPDIARLAKIDPATLGYRLTTGAEGVDRSRVRVFGIAGGTASELPRYRPRRPARGAEPRRR